MENKEFNISKPVSAFIALVVAFLVIGYYVVNLLDIDTEGTTAEEALLPNVLGSPDETFSVRYPEGWTSAPLSSGYVFTLDDADEPKPEIRITLEETSLAVLLPEDQQENVSQVANPFTEGEIGWRYTMLSSEETGQTLRTDVVLYPLADRRTVKGELVASTNNINEYRETFNLMVESIGFELLEVVDLPPRDSIEPPELTETASGTGTTVIVDYPTGWNVQAVSNNSAYGISLQSEEAEIRMFALSPTDTSAGAFLLQSVAENTPTGITSAIENQLLRSQIVEITTPRTLGSYEGATIVVRNDDSVTENGVYAFSEDVFISYRLTTSLENLPNARATVDAVLQSFVYDAPIESTLEEAALLLNEVGEPLALTETLYSPSFDVTVRYPATWEVSEVPSNSGQPLLLFVSSDNPMLQIVSLVVPPEAVTANAEQTLLTQVEPSLSPDMLVQATTPVTLGELTGATVVQLELNRLPGQKMPNISEFGLYDLPNGGQMYLVASSSTDQFAQVRATTAEIASSVQLGDTTAADASSDAEDNTSDDSPTEDDSATSDESTDDTSEGDDNTTDQSTESESGSE